MWHWVTSTGCSAHDLANALRWANLESFGNRQAMRAMWVCVESLRSSLDQLLRCLPSWLQDHLAFDRYEGDVDLVDFWKLLGLHPDWCEELAVLQVRFRDGVLLVAPQFEGDVALPQRLANIFMHLLEFRAWSDT